MTDIYSSDSGWTRAPGAPRLTLTLATELRAQGVTMVRTRWRFTTKEFTIASLIPLDYPGRRPRPSTTGIAASRRCV